MPSDEVLVTRFDWFAPTCGKRGQSELVRASAGTVMYPINANPIAARVVQRRAPLDPDGFTQVEVQGPVGRGHN